MNKIIKKTLLVIITPFVLYYGALAAFIVSWGVTDNNVYNSCVESQIALGNSQQDSMEQCL